MLFVSSLNGVVIASREKDLDEVLQTRTVYTNVSKAERADKKDMAEVFGTDDDEKVCLMVCVF